MRNIDTGMGARPDGGDPPGRPLGLRDRPGAAADRPRRGALRPLLRGGRRRHAGDADRRRPLARRHLPDRRRRRPLERGPRLHPAPDHAARDPAGPRPRPRVAVARPLRRAHDRDHGRRLPGAEARSARRSSAGSPTRRRASAAPSSAGPSCSSAWSRRRSEPETSWIDAADAFKLHDTFGFPYDLTKELLAEQGLSVDDSGFEELMDEQRQRARTGAATAHGSEDRHERVLAFAAEAPPTQLRRLRDAAVETGSRRGRGEDGAASWSSSSESPFYAEGGGQVADSGVLRWDGGEARSSTSTGVGRRPGARGRRTTGRRGAGRGRGRPRDPPRDDAQPHRHPPPPRRSAGPARDPRAPGGLRGAAGQAALRLHPWPGAERRGAARRRGPGQRLDQGEPPGPLAGNGAAARPRSSARWPSSARNTASGCGWSRSTASPASSAAAPTSPTPPRSASSRSPRRARAPPTCGGSRRSPARRRSTGSASASSGLREVGELLGAPQDPVAGARKAAERLREAGEGEEQAAARGIAAEAKAIADAEPDLHFELAGGQAVAVDIKRTGVGSKQLLALAKEIRARRRPGRSSSSPPGDGKAGVLVLASESAIGAGSLRGEAGRRDQPR